MKKLIVIGIVIGAAVVAFFAARNFLDDADGLGGTWDLLSAETVGKTVFRKGKESITLTFGKDKVTWTIADKEDQEKAEGVFRIDSTKEPKEIDLAGLFWRGAAKGIYKFTDDTLIICVGPARPTEFGSKGDNLVMTLKRQ